MRRTTNKYMDPQILNRGLEQNLGQVHTGT